MGSTKKDAALLAGLIAMLVVRPLLVRGNTLSRGLLGVVFISVFVAVVHLIFTRRRERQVGLTLLIVLLVATAARWVVPARLEVPLELVFHASTVGFAGLAVTVILRDIFERPTVVGGEILAVVSGYVLSGIGWGSLYAIVYLLEPGSFGVDASIAWQLDDWALRRTLFDYLSFATITTIGYGYVTPATPFAETLTWLEVMFGQFYMAIVVAQLVGMKLAASLQARDTGPV